MIRCKICDDGKLFENLTTHLKYKHNITTEEYKKKFNVKHLQCKSLRKAISKRMENNKNGVGHTNSKKHRENSRIRALGNDYAKGNKQSEEAKEKISKGLGGNTNAKGHKQSKEQIEILRKVNKGNEYTKGRKASKEENEGNRQRAIKMRKDGIISVEKSCKNGNVKWYKIRNHIGDIEKVQGSFERRVGKALTRLGIRWKKYKGKGIPYKLNGKEKRYFPDFWLKDDRYYFEMKNYIGKDNFEMIVAKQMMMDKRGKRKGWICEMMFDIDIKKLEREVKLNKKRKNNGF